MLELSHFQRDFAAAMAMADQTSALAVYRNTCALGVIDALVANYPAVRRTTGDSLFRDLAARFAELFPPRDPILATYGEGFADYLACQPVAHELPYLADIARIDRLYLEALFGPDAPPLDPGSLRMLDPPAWEKLHLEVHPAARFAWFGSPAMTIWLAFSQAHDPDEIVVEWCEGGALMSRPFDAVEAHPLDLAGYCLLSAIRAGQSVGDAAIMTQTLHPDADVGARFAALAAAGLFASPTD